MADINLKAELFGIPAQELLYLSAILILLMIILGFVLCRYNLLSNFL